MKQESKGSVDSDRSLTKIKDTDLWHLKFNKNYNDVQINWNWRQEKYKWKKRSKSVSFKYAEIQHWSIRLQSELTFVKSTAFCLEFSIYVLETFSECRNQANISSFGIFDKNFTIHCIPSELFHLIAPIDFLLFIEYFSFPNTSSMGASIGEYWWMYMYVNFLHFIKSCVSEFLWKL